MNERIRQLRTALGLSQKDFADRIGLKQSAISFIEKDGSTITEQNIKAICTQFFVNEDWLRAGRGEMILVNERNQQAFIEIYEQLSPVFQDYLIQSAANLLEAQRKLQKADEEA